MRLPRIVLMAALPASLALLPRVPVTRTVTLVARADATLIEDPDGSRANGSGPGLFAGRTGQVAGSVRRGLLAFDVAAALPRGARVESVTLEMHLTDTNAGPERVTVHRVLSGWSEGPAASSGGGGAPAGLGDVTWLHTSWARHFWPRPGGHYVARASAGRPIDGPGTYAWPSTRELVRDVRLWRSAPHRNFGWILVGNESSPTTVKRFDSRESAALDRRPTLTIRYRP